MNGEHDALESVLTAPGWVDVELARDLLGARGIPCVLAERPGGGIAAVLGVQAPYRAADVLVPRHLARRARRLLEAHRAASRATLSPDRVDARADD